MCWLLLHVNFTRTALEKLIFFIQSLCVNYPFLSMQETSSQKANDFSSQNSSKIFFLLNWVPGLALEEEASDGVGQAGEVLLEAGQGGRVDLVLVLLATLRLGAAGDRRGAGGAGAGAGVGAGAGAGARFVFAFVTAASLSVIIIVVLS